MRKNNDLGKYVSDKLQNLDQSPREDLWDKIELDLDKKKKKKSALSIFHTANYKYCNYCFVSKFRF